MAEVYKWAAAAAAAALAEQTRAAMSTSSRRFSWLNCYGIKKPSSGQLVATVTRLQFNGKDGEFCP